MSCVLRGINPVDNASGAHHQLQEGNAGTKNTVLYVVKTVGIDITRILRPPSVLALQDKNIVHGSCSARFEPSAHRWVVV